jgi:hypothetical protein
MAKRASLKFHTADGNIVGDGSDQFAAGQGFADPSSANASRKQYLLPRGHKCPECAVTGSVPGLKRHVQKAHGWSKSHAADYITASGPVFPGVTLRVPAQETEPEAAPEPAVDLYEAKAKYEAMKAAELKALAKAAGIEGWHGMKKAELIDALSTVDWLNATAG